MASLPPLVRLGTRGSLLARWQTDHVAGQIRALGVEVEVVVIQTTGDLDQRSAFGLIPDKGLFVKELEQALLDRRIDLAVHSLKDLPTELPEGLTLAAVPERESPLDALVSRNELTLDQLPAGARVATGSLRRAAQILALRPDLKIVPIRGNVPTRLEKIKNRGEAEATLLAVAGLRRLGLAHEITQVLTPEQLTPAMGQGALAIEARAGELDALWARLNDPTTRRAVEAERVFLARVGGGCRTPVGILAEPVEAGAWQLTALLSTAEGHPLMRRRQTVKPQEDPCAAAARLAETMLAAAPPEIQAMLARIDQTTNKQSFSGQAEP